MGIFRISPERLLTRGLFIISWHKIKKKKVREAQKWIFFTLPASWGLDVDFLGHTRMLLLE